MTEEKIPLWLNWARRLQAISQSGIHFAKNDFDLERFEKIQEISTEIMQNYTNLPENYWLEEFSSQKGYATPKVAVRAAVFNDHHILLVKEKMDGRWSMPGGWADLNNPPSKMIEREVLEESGFIVKASKLIAVHESNHGLEPLEYWHSYKLVFLCDLLGGFARPSIETTEISFFPIDDLPELSPSRVSEDDIREAYYYLDHPNETTYFD
jgi:ADP-ribose pyrophosphatase YjhB (NUDIX family)